MSYQNINLKKVVSYQILIIHFNLKLLIEYKEDDDSDGEEKIQIVATI